MNYLRKVLSTLGGIFLAALLISAVVPKAARGVAAALVQIVPGSTTHLGQHETQLVSLVCSNGSNSCSSIDPSGQVTSTPYVVPSGYTLIVTDWEWQRGSSQQGAFSTDFLFDINSGNSLILSGGLADVNSFIYKHEHYEAGIRVASGATIGDLAASRSNGTAFVQGYLVPN